MKTRENQLLRSGSRPKVYVAGRDFNLKNLKVKKGQMLPDRWCTPTGRTYLKDEYGKDSVILTDQFIDEDSKESAKTIQELTERITKLENIIAETSSEKEKVKKVEPEKEQKQEKNKRGRPKSNSKTP